MDKTLDIGKMRVAAGLTQAQLADAAGCTQATIARIEKGANARKALMLQILYVLRHESKENAELLDSTSARLDRKEDSQCAECGKKADSIKSLREVIEAQKAAIEAMKQTIETMKRDQGHPSAPPGTPAQTARVGGRKLPA